MGDLKWPSFIIQGIILATITTFMIKGGGYINTWMFISLLAVMCLFALQTTSTDFLYLYRVNATNGKDATNYKTHILRITTMLSIISLYLGIYHPNSGEETLSKGWFNGYFVTVIVAFIFLLVVPLLFNFIGNKKA